MEIEEIKDLVKTLPEEVMKELSEEFENKPEDFFVGVYAAVFLQQYLAKQEKKSEVAEKFISDAMDYLVEMGVANVSEIYERLRQGALNEMKENSL